MNKEEKIFTIIIIVCAVILVATTIFAIINYNRPKDLNMSAHYIVGQDGVTAIEIIYAQTHDRVEEIILYKDDTAIARAGVEHIYIHQSTCKIVIYRG